jgi:hypothetical protein
VPHYAPDEIFVLKFFSLLVSILMRGCKRAVAFGIFSDPNAGRANCCWRPS